MKFFKQTKETKRKISFFMALAMIISLLPVSPVVKAASADTETVSNCNVYVNLDDTSKQYVKVAEVVTGGATDGKEATTASVIVAPLKGITFENVKAEKADVVEVKSNEAVTLGSISLKKGDVTTSASVVVRKADTDAASKASTSAAVSSSALNGDVIAKVSLSATGPAVASKNITGAVISVDGLASDIEVAIVMPSGKEVVPPAPSDEKVSVKFTAKLTDVVFNATIDGKTVATSSGSITVDKNSTIALEIKPSGDDKEFAGEPKVTVDGKASPVVLKKGIYTGTITIGETKAEVSIEAAAKDKPAVNNEFVVTYSGTVAGADITVSLSGSDFKSGSNVKANDTLDITITPKSGYYFEDGKLPEVALKDAESATLTKTGITGNAYKASVSKFTAKTEITISGKAKEAKVQNETKPEDNVGAATLDTESIQAVETDIKDAFYSDKVSAMSAAAVKAALVDKGTIGVSLSVTDAGINAADEEKGKSAIVSDDKSAKDKAVALDISLIAICRDKNKNEVARVEVNELTKEVKITIAADGIFKNGFNKTPATGFTRNYWVIRVHNGKTDKIKCDYVNGYIVFSSKLFSTYVFYYEDVKDTKPDNPSNPSNPGGPSYIPSSSTATPAPSATPSATPDASATPAASTEPGASTTPSASPSGTEEPGTGIKPDPTKAPGNNNGDDDNNTGNNAVKVKVGKKVTVNSSKYKVTSVSGTRAVQFTSGKKNAKNVVIPSTVKISGKNYKVTSIANNAFKNNKKLKKVTIGVNVNKIGKAAFKGCKNLKSIIIKTNKLTAKKVGANAFKGINKKATFKVPKKKVKAYKKIVKAKGAAKTVKVKK